LQRREVDVMAASRPTTGQLEKVPGVKMANFPGFTSFGIKVQLPYGPTADLNVRKGHRLRLRLRRRAAIHNGMAER
jgi:hypothetical protein